MDRYGSPWIADSASMRIAAVVEKDDALKSISNQALSPGTCAFSYVLLRLSGRRGGIINYPPYAYS